jgi:hypothetical protein
MTPKPYKQTLKDFATQVQINYLLNNNRIDNEHLDQTVKDYFYQDNNQYSSAYLLLSGGLMVALYSGREPVTMYNGEGCAWDEIKKRGYLWNSKPYTTKKLAAHLKISIRGARKIIERDQKKPKEARRYPDAYQCDCEKHNWLIPRSDVDAQSK